MPSSKRADLKTVDEIPDKILLRVRWIRYVDSKFTPFPQVFLYLEHRDMGKVARVCRRWKGIAYDPRLWQEVSLRADSGLHITNIEFLLQLIHNRFGQCLKYLELPIDLITAPVLHELSRECPNLRHMVLDFSNAMQLHDFQDLQAFPPHLRTLCICLSDVIFMEGFMRQIYKFLNTVEVLQLGGGWC